MNFEPFLNQPIHLRKERRTWHTLALSAGPIRPRPHRFSKEYQLNPDITSAFSYNQTRAFLHFLTNNTNPKPTVYPDWTALKGFDLYDEVFQRVLDAGLRLLVEEDPGMYSNVVMEFFPTLKVHWEDGKAIFWEFKLGDETWMLKRDRICRHLGITDYNGGMTPDFGEVGRNFFWEKISNAGTGAFIACLPASMIKNPVWRIMHFLIVNTINARGDGGLTVTNEDLDILNAIHSGYRMDLFSILSARFQNYANLNEVPKALGGGSFLTRLAVGLGYTFTQPGRPAPRRAILDFSIA
ncbi:unnamed protein product [Rhodiola kirilowii]